MPHTPSTNRPNLFLLDLAEGAADTCLLALRFAADQAAADTPYRVITFGTSQQEARAAELGIPPLDHCPRHSEISTVIVRLRPASVTVSSATLWHLAARVISAKAIQDSPNLSLAGWSLLGSPLQNAPSSAKLQLTDIGAISSAPPTPRLRHTLRESLGLADQELAVALIGPWPQQGLTPPCTLFSRVIGMLALGGFPVVGVADGAHDDMHHAATFVRTVEDQFELISTDGPVEAGLHAFDALVWLSAEWGGSVAAIQALSSGIPVVTVDCPVARQIAKIFAARRAAGETVGQLIIAPLATMASVGSRLMEALGLVEPPGPSPVAEGGLGPSRRKRPHLPATAFADAESEFESDSASVL